MSQVPPPVVTIVEHQNPAEDEPFEEYTCTICGSAVGAYLTEDPDGYDRAGWGPYVTVQADGDLQQTVFCEDDYGWLEDVADAVAATRSRTQVTPGVIVAAHVNHTII